MLLPVGMGKRYCHLNQQERGVLEQALSEGLSLRAIANVLGRNVSSLSREMKRNGKRIGRSRKPLYESKKAEEKSKKRFQKSHCRGHLKSVPIQEYVSAKLLVRLSPELIAGRLSLDHPDLRVSHEAIYQWIYRAGREYIPFLARKRRLRRSRTYSKRKGKINIPCRVSIDERPMSINERKEPGHWEVDLIESQLKRGALQIITERKTRYSFLTKLRNLTGIAARETIINRMLHLKKVMRKTFTYDNGAENTYHVRVNMVLGTKSYFCNPYHGWEKGTVENTIGIVRRFYPKGTDFIKVPEEEIKKLEEWLNGRPRKCLEFKTPSEAFKLECCT